MIGCKLHHLVAQMALVIKLNAELSINECIFNTCYVLDIVRMHRQYKTSLPFFLMRYKSIRGQITKVSFQFHFCEAL